MKTYGWTNDEAKWSFFEGERHSLLLLQAEHKQRQGEGERFARACVSNADQIPACQSIF